MIRIDDLWVSHFTEIDPVFWFWWNVLVLLILNCGMSGGLLHAPSVYTTPYFIPTFCSYLYNYRLSEIFYFDYMIIFMVVWF